jgi:hypothetical protein
MTSFEAEFNFGTTNGMDEEELLKKSSSDVGLHRDNHLEERKAVWMMKRELTQAWRVACQYDWMEWFTKRKFGWILRAMTVQDDDREQEEWEETTETLVQLMKTFQDRYGKGQQETANTT